jgi:GMP synthase-like glutamine amidotransferase
MLSASKVSVDRRGQDGPKSTKDSAVVLSVMISNAPAFSGVCLAHQALAAAAGFNLQNDDDDRLTHFFVLLSESQEAHTRDPFCLQASRLYRKGRGIRCPQDNENKGKINFKILN